MKIARYQAKYCVIISEADEYSETNPEYVRTSEIIDVEFVDRDPSEVTKEKVASVDNRIEEARAAYQVLMNTLEDEKAKLLAITHEVSE